MKRHLSYLKYVLRHKVFVFRAGLITKAPIWNLLVHDWSKFLPSEWGPYAHNFRNEDGSVRDSWAEGTVEGFFRAVHLHKSRNKHHPEWWVDSSSGKAYDMPLKYIREMVADWIGAGRAQSKNGSWSGVFDWYRKNGTKLNLSDNTRRQVEAMLEYYEATDRLRKM